MDGYGHLYDFSISEDNVGINRIEKEPKVTYNLEFQGSHDKMNMKRNKEVSP